MGPFSSSSSSSKFVQLRLRHVGLGVSTRALVELGLVSKSPFCGAASPVEDEDDDEDDLVAAVPPHNGALPIALPTRAFFDSTGCMRGLTAIEIKG
jgi:hypothetical protein